MRIFSFFFLMGTVFVQFLDKLPSFSFLLFFALSILLIVAAFLKIRSHLLKFLLLISSALFFGILLSSFTANEQIHNRLATEYEGKNIVLIGVVKDIPDNRKEGIRFRFDVREAYQLIELEKPLKIRGVVRLGWFQNIQQVRAGESWKITVRLKQPSGFMNYGGFDYEKWLFTQRIIATGYVRKSHENQRLSKASKWSVNHLREKIHLRIQNTLEDKPSAAVLSALMVAVRTNLDNLQWKVFQKTGTSHLIAISGLHIVIVAGFAFFPVMLIWRVFPRLNEYIPLNVAGSVASVSFATMYALLAGFTLPTQRALLMVIIMFVGLILRKNYSSSLVFSVALFAVLLFDPLAAMTISFWLSFSAVAFILIIMKRQNGKLRFQVFKLQLLLTFGMFPLTLLFFSVGSLSAPIANFFAIPWVSVFIVPVGILGVIFLPFSDAVSGMFFDLAGLAIKYLLQGLKLLSELPLSEVSAGSIPVSYLILSIVGVLLLLLPKGFPARWLGLIFLLSAVFFTSKKPEYGSFNFSLLDVGQGMASVIHTKSHTLIYDVGTRMSDRFDMGELVVIPYLKKKGVMTVDMMILSHDNLDHRGGANAIIQEVNVKKIISSDIQILSNHKVDLCITGQSWQWDGVNFEILSPDKGSQMNDNNQSCVLRVSNKYHSILLTGDIQKKAEKNLLNKSATKLQSEVLSVPHHGSKTSSTLAFIKAVSPSLAVIPVGYRNRFGHPKMAVLERYLKMGITIMDTANAGEIEVNFPASEKAISVLGYRSLNQHFWSRPVLQSGYRRKSNQE